MYVYVVSSMYSFIFIHSPIHWKSYEIGNMKTASPSHCIGETLDQGGTIMFTLEYTAPKSAVRCTRTAWTEASGK